MKLAVDIDVRDALSAVRRTVGEFPDRAIVPALNRTIRSTRTAASREIAQRMGPPFSSRVVLKSLRFTTAQRLTLTATLEGRGAEVVSLSRYRHRQTKAGVRATVAGRQMELAHAFRPKGLKQIFIRAAGSVAQQYTQLAYQPGGRLPIARIVAPGVPRIFREAAVLSELQRTARERFQIELERVARAVLARIF